MTLAWTIARAFVLLSLTIGTAAQNTASTEGGSTGSPAAPLASPDGTPTSVQINNATFVLHSQPASFVAAQQHCVAAFGNLASAHDLLEAQVLKELCAFSTHSNSSTCWIGLQVQETADATKYTWVDGTELNFPIYPAPWGPDMCVYTVYTADEGQDAIPWQLGSCDTQLPYLCRVSGTAGQPPGQTSTPIPANLTADLSSDTCTSTYEAGDDITCTVVVTNAGRDWLTGVDLLGQANCSYLLLLPGTSVTCSVTSTVTQADLDSFDTYGLFKNITAHAVAYRLSNTSQLIGDTQTVDLPLPVYTGLDLRCEAEPTLVSKAGALVNVTVVANNTGNVRLRGLNISISVVKDLNCNAAGAAGITLPAGEKLLCEGTMYYDQYALEAGTRDFTAVGTAANLNSSVSSDLVRVDVEAAPRLQLDVVANNCTKPTKLPGSAVCAVRLSNNGNMRLANVSVSGDNNDCAVALLEPNSTVHCSMSRTLSQEDYDAGFVNVTANGASAVPFGPVSVLPPVSPDTATVVLNQNASLDLSASSDQGYVGAAGESVKVVFTAGNTGSVTLHNATFTFSTAVSNVSCGSSGASVAANGSVQLFSLAVDTVMNCSGVLYFDQDRLEAGAKLLRVTGAATGGNVTVSASSQDVSIIPVNSPRLTLDLLGLPNCSLPADAGGTVVCPVIVENSGNVRLQNVSVAGVPGCNFTLLQPLEQQVCQLQKLVSQIDFDAAEDNNTPLQLKVEATAVPKGSNSSAVTTSNNETVPLQSVLHVVLQISNWSAQPALVSSAGDSVSYSLTLINSGNVKLHALQLAVPQLQGNTSAGSITCVAANGDSWPADSDLAAAHQLFCSGNYTFMQEAIEAGDVVPEAVATAGNLAQQRQNLTVIRVTDRPSLTVSVDTSSCNVPGKAGDRLYCPAQLVNGGNVRFSDVSLSSNLDCSNLTSTLLLVNGSVNCSISIVSTQDDFKAGNMSWAVTATATPLGIDSSAVTATAAGSVGLLAAPVLSLRMLRRAANDSIATSPVREAGAVVVLVLTATNAGNVVLYNVSLRVPGLGASLVCNSSLSVLNVSDAVECSGNFTYDQDALEAGTRSFTAVGIAANLVSNVSSDPVTVEVVAVPSLQVDVEALNCTKSTEMPGSVVCAVLLSNNGNMRLANVSVSGDDNDCAVALLEPGNTTDCSMSRTLSQEDYDAGFVNLTASGASAVPLGPVSVLPIVPSDTATVVLNQNASLDLSASSDQGSVVAAGDSVRVVFTTGNTGSVTLRNASFTFSPAVSNVSCASNSTSVAADGRVQLSSLAVHTTMSCSGFLYFDQDRLEAGPQRVHVTGAATGGNVTVSASSQDVSITPFNSPGLRLDLLGLPNCSLPASAGGPVVCPVVVQNSGNVRLQNVSVAGVPGCNFTLLQPLEQQVCQVQQLVSQTDLDAAEDTNTSLHLSVEATAVPKGSNSSAVTTSNNETVPLQSVLHAALQISNWSAAPALVSSAGDSVNYSLTLINSGNVKLHALQLIVPELQGSTSAGSITCVVANGDSWPADSDLAAALIDRPLVLVTAAPAAS